MSDNIELAANVGNNNFKRLKLLFRHGYWSVYRLYNTNLKDDRKLICRRFQHLRFVHSLTIKHSQSVLVASCSLFSCHFICGHFNDILLISTSLHLCDVLKERQAQNRNKKPWNFHERILAMGKPWTVFAGNHNYNYLFGRRYNFFWQIWHLCYVTRYTEQWSWGKNQ